MLPICKLPIPLLSSFFSWVVIFLWTSKNFIHETNQLQIFLHKYFFVCLRSFFVLFCSVLVLVKQKIIFKVLNFFLNFLNCESVIKTFPITKKTSFHIFCCLFYYFIFFHLTLIYMEFILMCGIKYDSYLISFQIESHWSSTTY